jgi:hypothetical protein
MYLVLFVWTDEAASHDRGANASNTEDFFFYFDFLIIIQKMNSAKRFFSNLVLLSHANLPGVTG